MTDKELLELAAKAAGFEVIRPMDEAPLFNGRDWEPLLTLVELKRFAALVYAAGAEAERKRIINLLMIQHEMTQGRHNYFVPWNPRHDNNDAFRLAARLKIQVSFGTFKDNVASAYKFGTPAVEVENTDIEAAAREAIFLMAVEIGRGMK
jgi:hypothetical protein